MATAAWMICIDPVANREMQSAPGSAGGFTYHRVDRNVVGTLRVPQLHKKQRGIAAATAHGVCLLRSRATSEGRERVPLASPVLTVDLVKAPRHHDGDILACTFDRNGQRGWPHVIGRKDAAKKVHSPRRVAPRGNVFPAPPSRIPTPRRVADFLLCSHVHYSIITPEMPRGRSCRCARRR
jgi:hypothetical protein